MGENFLSVISPDKNIVVFSCESNFQALYDAEKMYLDGTFGYCLKSFTQLFTLHIIVNGHYVPLAFCILPNKHVKTYKDVIQLLKNECLNLNFNLNHKYVVVDFEKSIHNSLISVWPEMQLIGCRFHLAQSWYRKIQEIGLVTAYKTAESE